MEERGRGPASKSVRLTELGHYVCMSAPPAGVVIAAAAVGVASHAISKAAPAPLVRLGLAEAQREAHENIELCKATILEA